MKSIKTINTVIGKYPEISDSLFHEKINKKKEFLDCDISKKFKDVYNLEPQQRFLSNYIDKGTGYDRILVYHSVGVGKTLTGIAIAEKFKDDYNIIVVSKNKNIEENFKRSIEKFREFNNKNTSPVEDYNFVSYRSISSKNPITGINFDKGVENTVFIMDEIHNALGNSAYFSIMELFKKSKNIKVVLLTATPIFDSVKEIFHLTNLLNENVKLHFSDNISMLLKNKYINFSKNVNNKYNILGDKVYYITSEGKKKISERLKGKVSYLVADLELFPERIYEGAPISKEKGSINIFRCYMSSFQEEIYKKTLKIKDVDNSLYKQSSDSLTIVYPDGSYGMDGFDKNIKSDNFLKINVIQKYSAKLYSLFNNLKKSKGPIFIYSNYVNKGGIELVKFFLLKNGYSFYGSRGDTPKITIFDENMKISTKRKILRVFNNANNKYGDDIKIIIGGPSVSEGITFKNIRQIHVLEPYWNLSRIEQVIGRGVRFGSHQILPPYERKVSVYLYTSVGKFSSEETSLDFLKYKLSEDKDKSSKHVEQILRNIAVDCSLNKKRNLQTASKNYTRECQYSVCDYSCPVDVTKQISKKSIDYSTYDLKKHDIEQYNYIIEKIKELYKISSVFTLKDILRYVKKNNFSYEILKDNIIYCLVDLIKNKEIIENYSSVKGFIINIEDYFILNPENNKIPEPLFYKIFQKEMYYIPPDLKGLNETRDKLKNTKIKISRELLKLKGLYGYYTKEGVFKIIDNRDIISQESNTLDDRSRFKGKSCMSFKSAELNEMMKFLKESIPKNSKKNNLCYLIENKLKKSSKIIRVI